MTEHQVSLQSGRIEGPDEVLDQFADAALQVLCSDEGPAAFALGPVVTVDLEARQVELLMTVEAHTLSDLHQKVALIAGELARGAEQLPLQSSETRETDTHESEDGDLVAA